MHLRLGTRGSALALAQSRWIAGQLSASAADIEIELVRIVTEGDRSQATGLPLSAGAAKGVFARDIERALLDGEIDFAVHSAKDLAAELPTGLVIAAVPRREDPRDAMVGASLAALAPGARVGTGSARRAALLREARPDLNVCAIRGNVDTRLRKLEGGEFEAIVLAVAGLKRLGLAAVVAEKLDPLRFVPDPGQGALAVQARSADTELCARLRSALENARTARCLAAERAFLRAVGGGCSAPVGAWANFPQRRFTLHAMLAAADGAVRRVSVNGHDRNPEWVGREAARLMEAAPS